LKLVMVIRAVGVKGLQERIRYHCGLGREFARWVEAEPGFELSAPVPFSTVCFRATPDLPPDEQDRFNERLLAEVNAPGPIFISHTKLRGRYVLRLTVGNLRTKRKHVERAWELVRTARARMLAG
jgi:aromatic-L-amino-acid decarboxylase